MGIDMSQIRTATQTETKLNARTAALAAAMIVAVFGAVFIYGMGFAGADVLHNAAHDTRHSLAFPVWSKNSDEARTAPGGAYRAPLCGPRCS